MSARVDVIKIITGIGLNRLDELTKGLREEQLDWRPTPEANTLRWFLTHEAYILHVVLPRVLFGGKGYKPEGWPDDYVGNSDYSLEKILGDLKAGREALMAELDRLTDEVLAEEIDYFGGRTREWSILWLVSEIIHHEGQIAATSGLHERMKE
ncbi:MAG: DinB family protein [Candidatus Bathyarchaeota archaeon]|nr:MAG: DinB family protein [Candidatus Bathyarchaeota archaeon]